MTSFISSNEHVANDNTPRVRGVRDLHTREGCAPRDKIHLKLITGGDYIPLVDVKRVLGRISQPAVFVLRNSPRRDCSSTNLRSRKLRILVCSGWFAPFTTRGWRQIQYCCLTVKRPVSVYLNTLGLMRRIL